jgi:soluble lytic murein transglycosylase-like protein
MKVTRHSSLGKQKLTFIALILMSQYACADIYLDASATDEIRLSNNPTDVACCVLIVEPAANLTDVTTASNDAIGLIGDTKKINQLPFNKEVAAAAKETLLEPALIHAVIATESHHNPRALSPRGAQGLMQLMPFTARRFSVRDAFNPAQNILAGARYLRELKDFFNGDIRLALAAYNAGPQAVNRYGNTIPPFHETLLYVPKVLNTYQKLNSL